MEHRRIRATLDAVKDSEELLGGAAAAPSADLEGGGAGAAALTRERAMVASTSAALDGVIGQAQNIVSGLVDQRQLLGGVGKKLILSGSRIPLVNSILSAIRRKRSKDTLILSAVIAGCIVFCIVYVLTK